MFKIEIKFTESKDKCKVDIIPIVSKSTTKNEKVTGALILQEIDKVIKKMK